VGGVLYDSSPRETAIVSGHSFVGDLKQPHRFMFRNGISVGEGNLPLPWSQLEYLARAIGNGVVVGQFDVHVMCGGGTYSMTSVFGEEQMSGKSGRSVLVVAFTNDPITLHASSDGRQLDASILAPFSDVTIDASVGYVDGFVVAKSLHMPPNAGSVQLHARCFQGALLCTHIQAARCSESGRACSDDLSAKRCQRKFRKGKCRKQRLMRKCALTCGAC